MEARVGAMLITIATKKIAETEAILAKHYKTMPPEMYVRLVTTKARFEWAVDEILRKLHESKKLTGIH